LVESPKLLSQSSPSGFFQEAFAPNSEDAGLNMPSIDAADQGPDFLVILRIETTLESWQAGESIDLPAPLQDITWPEAGVSDEINTVTSPSDDPHGAYENQSCRGTSCTHDKGGEMWQTSPTPTPQLAVAVEPSALHDTANSSPSLPDLELTSPSSVYVTGPTSPSFSSEPGSPKCMPSAAAFPEIISMAWCLYDLRVSKVIVRRMYLCQPSQTSSLSHTVMHRTGISPNSLKSAPNLATVLSTFTTELNQVVPTGSLHRSGGFGPRTVFLTYDAFDLLGQLSMETRLKGIPLPTFLAFPTYFAFTKEFLRWMKTQKLSLTGGLGWHDYQNLFSTSIVRGIPSYSEIPLTWQWECNSPFPSPLHRCEQLAQWVTALRSSPALWTRPIDTFMEWTQFRKEKSSVLHGSFTGCEFHLNELMDWIQHHRRLQHRLEVFRLMIPGPTGNTASPDLFFKLGSHEDALMMLQLSGHLFHHVPLILTPSSPQILAQASPYCTSERSMDWICNECQFRNFATRKQCLRCKDRARLHQIRPGDWVCPMCQFQNFASRAICLKCGIPSPTPPPALSPVPFRAGDWICGSCAAHNFASRIHCVRCGGSKTPWNGRGR
jgi:hypothetical protein